MGHCSWEVQMQKIAVTIKIRNSCMNNSVEALILFNEGHQSLLKLHVHLGVVQGFSMGGKGGCVMLHCFREDQCQQVFTKGKWRKRLRRPNIVIFVV